MQSGRAESHSIFRSDFFAFLIFVPKIKKATLLKSLFVAETEQISKHFLEDLERLAVIDSDDK
ncbi:MAG TPA: hypothetical protein DCG88_22455 [Sphingobacterium sp.]|nr:hypothetical protein [Sphingobacterium sp.]